MEVLELDGGLTGELHPATGRVLIAREQFGPKTSTGRVFGWPEPSRGSAWKVFRLREPAWRNPFPGPASPGEEQLAEQLYYHCRRYMWDDDALQALGDLAWLVPFYRKDHTKKARLARKKKMPAAHPPRTRQKHGNNDRTHDTALVSERAAAWANASGAGLAALIGNVEPASLDDEETIEYVKAAARVASWAESRRVGALHRFTEHRPNMGDETGNHQPFSRYAAPEIAAALCISTGSASTHIAKAHCLVSYMPRTYAALGKGTIDMARANKMMLHLPPLDDEDTARYEKELLETAPGLSPAQLEKQAMRVADKLHPTSGEERHETAKTNRSVTFTPAPDAMVEMHAYLPAAEATAIEALLEQTARSLQGPTEARTLMQLKADVLTDLALHHTGDANTAGTVKTEILITIPALTLMGHTDQPGDLEGHGPIPAHIARQLAGDSNSWYRVLTDPWTGSVLAHGRKHKKPPKDLKRVLRSRDGRCRFPGCNRRPAGCDIDHTTAREAGGRTDHNNLGHLCPAHHKTKHKGGWELQQLHGGIMRWTARTGHTYETTPDFTSAPVPKEVINTIEKETPPF